MIRKILLLLILLPIIGFGQQSALVSHYYENITLFNPSMAGYDENTSIRLNARQQWYKFTDTNIGRSSLSINKGFADDGVGVSIFSDNSGNIIKSGFNVSYSRRVAINDKSSVFFGLSGGYQNNQIQNISVLDFQYFDNKYNWSPNTAFGLTYNYESFLLGVSVDGLLDSDLGFTEQENILEKHYYAFMSYNFAASSSVDLKPSIFYKEAESGFSQFDLNLNLSYKNALTVGFGYKGNFSEDSDFGPLVTLGLNFGNIKSLISQEFNSSEVSSYSVGTTEITLSYVVSPKEEPIAVKKKEVETIEEEEFKDSDNDGVIDEEDLCPNEYGSKSAKGCPDFDNDGVRDSEDKCPNTIGDLMNGGCPLLSQEDSSTLVDAMINLEFDKNSSDLKQSSSPYLSNIGKLLLGNKNMLLIISGHTDSDASDEYNFSLSAKRAQAVRNYIIKMGVSKSRLIIDFYGETKPIVPNDTDYNKQKNRRVEFGVTFI
jgi:type IX secretion system PorP/SprF family membrane protein